MIIMLAAAATEAKASLAMRHGVMQLAALLTYSEAATSSMQVLVLFERRYGNITHAVLHVSM